MPHRSLAKNPGLLLLVASLVPLLLGSGSTAEPVSSPPALADWCGNIARSLSEESRALGGRIEQLRATSDQLTATGGDRDSVLLLARDVELVDRGADAVARKADRLAELSERLVDAVGQPSGASAP